MEAALGRGEFMSCFVRKYRSAWLLLLCLTLVLAQGCGKKGDPSPKDPAKVFTWEEVSVTSVNYCINFSGTLKGATGNLDYVRLDLSAVNGPEDCPGCPFVASETHMISPSDGRYDPKTGKLSFTYCPSRAEAYRWRASGVNVYRNLPHAVTKEGTVIMVR